MILRGWIIMEDGEPQPYTFRQHRPAAWEQQRRPAHGFRHNVEAHRVRMRIVDTGRPKRRLSLAIDVGEAIWICRRRLHQRVVAGVLGIRPE